MLKRLLAGALAVASLLAAQAAPKKPKLVVAIMVDQFRYDFLTRFRGEYTGGFDRLLTDGAVFASASYQHFPTFTAVGHSTFLSGATPSLSGIIANDWYDRAAGKRVTSVSDEDTRLVGGITAAAGSSPRKLLVSTVGDELKMATGGKARVIGVSLKDRSAILPVGHMADGAYWFDNQGGNFVSSTYYFPEAPGWVEEFNRARPADRYLGAKWLNHQMPAERRKLYAGLAPSPFGNELIEAFAERAVQAERLGMHDVSDLLSVSFSSNDYVGHDYGPDSAEVRELAVRTDRQLGRLLEFIDTQVGADNVLVVFSSDHGTAPVPEVNLARKMPGGRLTDAALAKAVQSALSARYGEGNWVASVGENGMCLNHDLAEQKKIDPADLSRTAAQVLAAIPHVFRVYTWESLSTGAYPQDEVSRRVVNGFFPRRTGDLTILLDPYWVPYGTGTAHGGVFSYDSHVPVIFLGAGIRPGRYFQSIAVNDVAPTLAAILEIETPSASTGRVLAEMFAR